jgi:hypothetical protein
MYGFAFVIQVGNVASVAHHALYDFQDVFKIFSKLMADQCHVCWSRSNHVGLRKWVENVAVGFNFHFGHCGSSGASFGG